MYKEIWRGYNKEHENKLKEEKKKTEDKIKEYFKDRQG